MAQKFHFVILQIEVTHALRGLSAIAELLMLCQAGDKQLDIDKAPIFPLSLPKGQRVAQKRHFAIAQLWVLAKMFSYQLYEVDHTYSNDVYMKHLRFL